MRPRSENRVPTFLSRGAFALCAVLATSFVTAPALAGDDQKRTVRDLEYGAALFRFYQEDFFYAAAHLLAASEQGRIVHHGDDAELLLGGIYLSYGQQREAGEIFDRLLDKGVRPEMRDRAWLYAAQIAYQRGRGDKAMAALERIQGELEDEDEARRRLLASQVLIEQARFDEAAAQLDDWRAPDGWRSYAQYNLGVALVRSGATEQGMRLLEKAGSKSIVAEVTDAGWLTPWRWFRRRAEPEKDYAEGDALRDKINLALGFAHLREGAPELAQPILTRVGDTGPWGSKARLGAGWAAVEAEQFQAALDAWQPLSGGDPLDPAVQESRLGIPYARARLGDEDGALEGYRDAIATFGDEIRRLEAMTTRIVGEDFLDALLVADDGNEVGWFWSLDEVPDDDRGRYLYRLMADHDFQEGLKNYRDLSALRDNLDRWAEGIEAFEAMIDTRENRFAEQTGGMVDDDSGVRLDVLTERVDDFTRRVETAVRDNDTLAFATGEELEAWARLENVERLLQHVADDPKYEAARGKQRLLKGVMIWRLNDEFAARAWEQRKAAKALAQQVRDARRKSMALAKAEESEPREFVAFRQRIEAMRPRIRALRFRVDSSMVAHEDYLKRIAIDQFDQHSRRLQAYLTEAQFALASTYDRLSRVEGVEQ